ncbi:MAG: hypothetical protein ACD_51C00312G0008 [uncultured bacterium]|nr:MAG: hypothetical protein ACD_51C00312G0008 [uncultured bacterium]OGJ47041.1 MAG: hypothetical protein A2244_04865 [Candidatus Peregrinibacteria bacterium RIFOXYA2_FULL_41_18]OGJ49729.1 MAG: hypothetical protein A2344_03525 [Candidatus Peregrinibacteria bacterium RIFOXYB12_FULL_41_12]OGJ53518.1 MAG: hypothetical protein A2448_01600 [Candidatus Peregrinibacteria bacterium RIFOXYC2_FULL_41_22]OGJ53733.1 MAG: hypothetical protein A2336_04025 [Candidatus Peregrinibacteria bacterium RIFOXYB2_FULL
MEDNSNKHFKGQQRDEEVVYYSCKHWITLAPLMIEFVLAVAILAALVSFLIGVENRPEWARWVFVAMTGVTALWLHSFFTRTLNYFLDIVIITNFRVLKVEKSLYLKDDQNIVDLHEIQDIKKIQHGIISNLFDYGKLVIVTPTMIEPMILENMPDPERFFRKVNNSKRDYIYQRQQRKLKTSNYEYADGQVVNQ